MAPKGQARRQKPHRVHFEPSKETISPIERAPLGHTWAQGATSHWWQETGTEALSLTDPTDIFGSPCSLSQATSQAWQQMHLPRST